jgi:hypothetical protein
MHSQAADAGGHRVYPGRPITGAPETQLSALALITDRLLGTIERRRTICSSPTQNAS